ncbi:EfeM/EfeO family lipoprotein [Xylanimonas ulmi]
MIVLSASAAALCLGACGGPDDAAAVATSAPAVAGTPVAAGPDNCGEGWTGGAAGDQTFAITNTATTSMAVYLQDAPAGDADARTYLVVDAIGAGATTSASVRLNGGAYRFVCLQVDEDMVAGKPVTVTGGKVAAATPSIVLLSQQDLIPPTQAYSAWALGRARTLAQQVAALDADAAAGDLAAARRDWLTAHTTYGTLGAAYGAFGDLGDAIDALPPRGASAAQDEDLTGFRKIEALLWPEPGVGSGTDVARAARPATRQLVADVASLVTLLQDPRMDPLELGLRAHEILEDVQRITLSGRADGPSGTTLAEVAAAVDGSRAALEQLRPLLTAQGFDLAPDDDALNGLADTVTTFEHDDADGPVWTSRADLTPAQREQLDARLDAALEPLARVAATTEPRRHS